MIDLPVAILCGGKGTRLGELTAHTPKSLVKVAGKPFIFHQLDLLAAQGVKKVVLCIGHLGDQIVEAVGNDYRGIAIHYWRDEHRESGPLGNGLTYMRFFTFAHPDSKPLGTLGAIRNASHLLGDEFLTLYGDSYLPGDWYPFVTAARDSGMMVAQTVDRDGTDYGLSWFRYTWKKTTELCTSIGDLHNLKACFCYTMPNRFWQIGDPKGLAEVEALLTPTLVPPMPPTVPTVIVPNATFTNQFLLDVIDSIRAVDSATIQWMACRLDEMRDKKGRLFIIGIGGSAANASHAVNDFRKLCAIEAYTPTDNAAEITARTNDEGWETVFSEWLAISKPTYDDVLLVLSVGGGTDKVSLPIVQAINFSKICGMSVLGIVGPNGGYTAKHARLCLTIPVAKPSLVTPITEAMQSVILHLLVTHPALKRKATKW